MCVYTVEGATPCSRVDEDAMAGAAPQCGRGAAPPPGSMKSMNGDRIEK